MMDLRAPPPSTTSVGQHRTGLLVSLHIVTLVVFALGVWLLRTDPEASAADDDAQRARQVASKLKAAGASDEAATMYEQYLQRTQASQETQARVAFSLGQLYLESGQYERALRWYYEAEGLGAKDLEQQINEKIEHCLERLGRVHAAKAALASRVELQADKAQRPDSDPVVAKIGNDEIRRSELTRALDDVAPQVRKHFAGADGLKQFLRKYVADELLWRKSQKLEIDKDPEVRRQLATMLKQLVVGKFIEGEVLGKITVDAEDLTNFHAANRSRYDQQEAVRLRVLQVASMETAMKLAKQARNADAFAEVAKKHSLDTSTKEQGGLLDRWVNKGEAFLPGVPAEPISDAIFTTPKGKVSKPVEAGSHVYVFRIEDKRPAKERSFDEVKRLVEQDYRMMKIQSAYQSIVEEQLRSEDVELFENKLEDTP